MLLSLKLMKTFIFLFCLSCWSIASAALIEFPKSEDAIIPPLKLVIHKKMLSMSRIGFNKTLIDTNPAGMKWGILNLSHALLSSATLQ
jgi:hypothetical protein